MRCCSRWEVTALRPTFSLCLFVKCVNEIESSRGRLGRSHAERFISCSPLSLPTSLSLVQSVLPPGVEQASQTINRERAARAPCRSSRIRSAGERASTPPRLRLIPLRPSADSKPSTHSGSAGLQPSKQRELPSETSTTWRTCHSRDPQPTKPTRRHHHRSQPRRLPNNNNAARQTATQRLRPSSQRRNARLSNRNTKPGPRTSSRTQRRSTSATASRKGSTRIGEPSSSPRGNAASAPLRPNKVSSPIPFLGFHPFGEKSLTFDRLL